MNTKSVGIISASCTTIIGLMMVVMLPKRLELAGYIVATVGTILAITRLAQYLLPTK